MGQAGPVAKPSKQQRRTKRLQDRDRPRPVPSSERPAALPFAEDPEVEAAHRAWSLVRAAAGGLGGVLDPRPHDELLDDLVFLVGSLTPAQAAFVDALITDKLFSAIAELYEYGWQPNDLRHLVRRTSKSNRAAVLFDVAIARQFALGRHPVDVVPPLWAAQVGEPLDRAGSLADLAGQHRWDYWESLIRCFAALSGLPRLEKLLPPPSQWSTKVVRASAGASDSSQLARIRALLAKAEATDFPEEAEALTGKAQELMAKYAIDEVLLGAAEQDRTEVVGRRIHLEDPYAAEKATLASVCVQAQHGKAIWDSRFAIVTLVGTPGDLDLAEMLFTSLLVQAVRAMEDVGRTSRAATRRPSFRRAFLISYANRISDRLEAATARAAQESGHSTELVPLFARRKAEVSAEFSRLFPRSTPGKSRSYDAAGWHAGTAAADRARLVSGQLD